MDKRHTKETKQAAYNYFEEGFGSKATASLLDLNVGTVRRWHELYRAGNLDWVTSSYAKTDSILLEKVVQEYKSTPYGFHALSVRYGISASTILRGYRNYINYGSVTLPKGRGAMKKLRQRKQALGRKLDDLDDNAPLDKKGVKEMRDLIIVNIALIDVILETDCPELKKKELRRQKEQLERRLAYVRRVLSSM